MPLDPSSVLRARIELLRQATLARPETVSLQYDLAELLIETGEVSEGVALFRAAYLAEPLRRPVFGVDKGDDPVPRARRCRTITDALIANGVNFSSVLAAAAWAAAVLGDRDYARHLVDYRRFFVEQPDAFPDLFTSEFAVRLAEEIRAGMQHHNLGWTAISQAWRNGAIMRAQTPACRALVARLRRAVDQFAADLPRDGHPFALSRPAKFALGGWAVVFDGDSRHISHIHPRSWLSGVFYIVQPRVSMGDARHRGWYRAGPTPDVPASGGWDERWVEPTPGKLILMPGYFPHETMPTGTDEERLCIAFDAMPMELANGVLESNVEL